MNQLFVIDIGNFRIKWAVADHRRILREHEFATSKFREIRRSKFPRLHLPDHLDGAIISCVVPDALSGVKACLVKLGIHRPIVVSSKLDLGIGLRYPRPQQIGADRLANAIAAVHLYGAPSVVIDFGTAVTFDVISRRKEYIGGVIAPGLSLMTDYLYEKTALLPRVSLKEPSKAIGKDTVAAMRIGGVIGYRGMIRGILRAIRRELGMDFPSHPKKKFSKKPFLHVIATGGDGLFIASKIAEIKHINPQLTIEGLRILYAKILPAAAEGSTSRGAKFILETSRLRKVARKEAS